VLDWSDVHVFLVVSRDGSFTAAARRLHLDQTTVGRRIAALEAQLGSRLFRRGRDGLALTAAGRELVPLAEQMEASASAFGLAAAGRDQRAEGAVRLTTLASVAERLLAPAVPALLAAHPALVLDLHADDRALSLTRREADLAIRAGRPAQSDLVVRRLARVAYAVYGARRARRLDPAAAPYVGLDDDLPADLPQTRWLAARNARVVLRSNHARTLVAAIEAGVGLGLLPCFLGDALPGLGRLVDPRDVLHRDLWLIVHAELARAPRIRAVIAWIDRTIEQQAHLLAG
jgi:DNA-binding transcriptional LysR family regulator